MAIKSPLLIERDEHDETLLAKKTSLVSAATIYAVVNSGTGGTSSTDDAVFNVGVDAGTPFMALADDTSPDSVNEGDVGVVRMTLNRWLETKMESAATIYAVVNTAAAGQSSIVLDDSISSIGFATVNVVNLARTITGNLTLSNAQTYIGLVTATPVGLVTTIQAGNATIIHGSNVTLNASAAYIGLVTAVNSYRSAYTSFSTVVSALATVIVPPAGQAIFVRNLHISSLGR